MEIEQDENLDDLQDDLVEEGSFDEGFDAYLNRHGMHLVRDNEEAPREISKKDAAARFLRGEEEAQVRWNEEQRRLDVIEPIRVGVARVQSGEYAFLVSTEWKERLESLTENPEHLEGIYDLAQKLFNEGASDAAKALLFIDYGEGNFRLGRLPADARRLDVRIDQPGFVNQRRQRKRRLSLGGRGRRSRVEDQ